MQGESNNTLLSIFWCTFCASMWSHCADGNSAQLLAPLPCPVDTLPAARARRRSAWPSRRRARPQPPSGQLPAAAQRHTSSVIFPIVNSRGHAATLVVHLICAPPDTPAGCTVYQTAYPCRITYSSEADFFFLQIHLAWELHDLPSEPTLTHHTVTSAAIPAMCYSPYLTNQNALLTQCLELPQMSPATNSAVVAVQSSESGCTTQPSCFLMHCGGGSA